MSGTAEETKTPVNDDQEVQPQVATDPAAAAAAAAALDGNGQPTSAILGEDPAALRQERVVVKFLIPNVAAGSIIGKSGANITEIQMQSGARMQLSKSNEFYPGTLESQDRILLISGTVDQLLTALHLVLSRLRAEPAALRAVQTRSDVPDRLTLRVLVHTRLCGTLIGKGGATIRSFNEDSNAAFNISPPPAMPGLTERVVKIIGEVDELMRAVALVITKLSENPDYHLLTDANLSYSQRVFAAPSGGGGGYRGQQQQQQFHHGGNGGVYGGGAGVGNHMMMSPGGGNGGGNGGVNNTNTNNGGVHATTVTLAVPEERVGSVIGKGGCVINQIKDLVNVNIRISKKGEYLPGTNDRACQISGAPQAVELAQRLVLQRVEDRE